MNEDYVKRARHLPQDVVLVLLDILEGYCDDELKSLDGLWGQEDLATSEGRTNITQNQGEKKALDKMKGLLDSFRSQPEEEIAEESDSDT